MEFSIIPIIYLICLSIILTPIAYFIFLQVFKFNNNVLILRNYEHEDNLASIDPEKNYYIANIYIQNQIWHIALAKLESQLYQRESITDMKKAECYNAIGFILHRLDCYIIAKKYYIRSSEIEPKYVYAEKNIKSLP